MKKETPLTVWQKIQPILNDSSSLALQVKSSRDSFFLKDADPQSDFFFKCGFMDDNGRYPISFKPNGPSTNRQHQELVNEDGIVSWLKQWLTVLKGYSELKTIWDQPEDPIEQAYQAEFITYFQWDDDADTVPFDMASQLYLEQYLDKIIGLLESAKVNATPTNAEEIEVIVDDCNYLKRYMTRLSKKKVVDHVTKIWARARKQSISLIKEILTEFKKEAIKTISKKVLESGVPTFDDIISFLH